MTKDQDGPGKRSLGAGLVLFTCMVVGAALRVRGLGTQIPMDDEWHGLAFALTRDLGFLFTHWSRAGANSIVYNLYLRATLVTVGWTELTIVLPSLVAGVGLLWAFPRWVARRLGWEAALVSSALLVLSPFLVFYSRAARAYSLLLLLECLALLALCEWLQDGRRRRAWAFVGFGALAIWTHASALPALLAALGVVSVRRLLPGGRADSPASPTARALVVAGGAMLGLAGLLWLPALLGSLPSPAHGAARFSFATVTSLFELWSGTANRPLQLLWLAGVAVGLRFALRKSREDVLVLGAALLGGLGMVLVARPNLAGVGFVLARYQLPAFLLASLAAAAATHALVRGAATTVGRNLRLGGVCMVVALLYFLGPLPRIHGQVNSFTKHPAFQASYAEPAPERPLSDPLDDGRSQALSRAQLQPIYHALARVPGTAPIIEYPFLLGEDANLLYFAQQLHGRPVLAGYYRSGVGPGDLFGMATGPRRPDQIPPPSPGFITNAMILDHVLGHAERDGRVRFRTVVDILDPAAVERSGAELIVLHANLLQEFFAIGPAGARSELALGIRQILFARYGMPVFENELVTVLRIARQR